MTSQQCLGIQMSFDQITNDEVIITSQSHSHPPEKKNPKKCKPIPLEL